MKAHHPIPSASCFLCHASCCTRSRRWSSPRCTSTSPPVISGSLFAGDVQWTHIWKGFGALAGAYVFAALASRGLARGEGRRHLDSERRSTSQGFGSSSA